MATTDPGEYPAFDIPPDCARTHRSVIRWLRVLLVHHGYIGRREAAEATCQVIVGDRHPSTLLNGVGVIGRSREPLPWSNDAGPVHEVLLIFAPGQVAAHHPGSTADLAPKYRLRFFFDTGSGVCLWTANDAAREIYDYPVSMEALPVSELIR